MAHLNYPKAMRDQAEAKGHGLMTLDVQDEKIGKATFRGDVTPAEAKALLAFGARFQTAKPGALSLAEVRKDIKNDVRWYWCRRKGGMELTPHEIFAEGERILVILPGLNLPGDQTSYDFFGLCAPPLDVLRRTAKV
jgi:hypothetical protein